MNAIRKILVPIDDFSNCQDAVDLASLWAKKNEAKIIFCYVAIPPLPPTTYYVRPELDELIIQEQTEFLKVMPADSTLEYQHEFLRGNPGPEIVKLAEEQKIDIKYFNIIYEAIEHVEKSLSGLLEPDVKETILGSAEIQKIFKVSTAGKIAGSKVISGEIKSKSKARIIRDGVVVYSGEILSIFREKNQVKEVGTGLECGISIKNFIDFKSSNTVIKNLSPLY